MRRKENLEIMKIAGDYLVVPTDGNSKALAGTVVLNEVSAFLLKAMKQDISREELLEKLLAEYAVERTAAQRDLDEILQAFEKLGMIDTLG